MVLESNMPINVLFATHYTGLGGGETALVTLAQALDPAAFRPHLLVPREGQLAEAWRAFGGVAHIVPFRGATVYFLPGLWARLPASRQMERLIRVHNIHAIHSDYHTLPLLLPAAERARIPALWTCMGWWFKPQRWQRGFFRRPAATFAHSEAIKRGFLGEPPFMPPDRIEVLYPGVDTDRFHPGVDGLRVRFEANLPPDAPVVALVARFQSVKGHEVFQAMARQVALQVPAARFIVAGENVHGVSADERYKRAILDAAAGDSILRDRLTYLGFRADVERVIGAADVVVCSSQFESFGVVNVEAMACGKPVVSTRRGGPSETVAHGETGYLVEPGDVAGMAAAVIRLLNDPELRGNMGRAGRLRAERLFSARATAARFAETVRGVV
jgi:glycosyltransferase involved in cell wall biosynthesis